MLDEVRPRPNIDIEAIRRGLAERQDRAKKDLVSRARQAVQIGLQDHWEPRRLEALRAGVKSGATLAGLCRSLRASKDAVEARVAREVLPEPRPSKKREEPWDFGRSVALFPPKPLEVVLRSHGLSDASAALYGGVRRPGEPLNFDEREQCAAMWADGFRVAEVADRVGASARECALAAVELGARRPAWFHAQLDDRGPYDWTERELGQLGLMVRRGMSADAIGEELGIGPDAVAERVYRCGWRFAKGKYLRHERDRYRLEGNLAECLRLVKAKEDPGRIAHLLGVKFFQVRRYFRILRGRGHEFDVKRYKPSPWTPEELHIPSIRAAYDLGCLATTVADTYTERELKAGAVKRIANQEGIAHPYWRRPWLQALRPEVLLFHNQNARLAAHLDDVLLCYPGRVGPEHVDDALRRHAEARRRYPDMRPWAHTQLEPRAERLRAMLRRLEDREQAFQRQVRRVLAA